MELALEYIHYFKCIEYITLNVRFYLEENAFFVLFIVAIRYILTASAINLTGYTLINVYYVNWLKPIQIIEEIFFFAYPYITGDYYSSTCEIIFDYFLESKRLKSLEYPWVLDDY